MNYLKNECERILNDLGYEYDENDVKIITETFDKNYNPDFEEYQIPAINTLINNDTMIFLILIPLNDKIMAQEFLYLTILSFSYPLNSLIQFNK